MYFFARLITMTQISHLSLLPKTLITRNFSLSGISQNNREGRFFKKILGNTKSKKKWQTDVPMPIINIGNSYSSGTETKKPINLKRVAILNKMFMRYITDLMATGENSSEFLGHGIEINKVKVTPDFQGVNVYWIAKGTEQDEEIEKLLIANSGILRHELSQLRVMGIVPKIHFIKDKEYAKLMEVDERLSIADFGEDFIPVEPSYKFKSEYKLDVTLPVSVKEKLEDFENDLNKEITIGNLPPMRQDILNLNHLDILTRIKKSIKKSEAPHRNTAEISNDLTVTVNENPLEFQSQRQQKEAFRQFLLKRQIFQDKAKRDRNKYCHEYEYISNENERNLYDDTSMNDIKELEDYIEDLEDEKQK